MERPNDELADLAEFKLNIRLVDAGPVAPTGVWSADCTSDNCGGTDDSAGVTC